MLELSAENAADYLGYPCSVTPLGGGVSNTVLLIETADRRFVLKQSLGKLRVEQDWFSDRRRIFRESSAIRQAAGMLPPGAVPAILFEDPENYLYAMSAAPEGARPWKDLLLSGIVDPATAARIGELLGKLISESWQSEPLRKEFGDQTVFDELRIDPYYRSTAARHPDLASFFQDLIVSSGERKVALVHGDWSPKNFLVSANQVMAIDFEVIHFGDPSFDAAFLLNHLLLKSFYKPGLRTQLARCAEAFWEQLPKSIDWFEAGAIQHLGALLLARIDGKSPAEYIQQETTQQEIRSFARNLIEQPPSTVPAVFERLARQESVSSPPRGDTTRPFRSLP